MLKKLYDLSGKRIFVAGHRGMVGSAILRRLQGGNHAILTVEREEVDLREQDRVRSWIAANKPDVIFAAAASVGGILANSTRPAEFLFNNLAIEANLFDASHRYGVERLIFLGSSCIYPRTAEQPITEDALLTGPLEPSNQWYAIAKIAGVKLVEAYRQQYGSRFISVMPTNLYGIGDNFNLAEAHVAPALMRKAHDAKHASAAELVVWGTGDARRELLFVDDLADALVFLAEHYDEASPINVGTGIDLTIRELAEMICRIVGFDGSLVFDTSMLNGTPRKLLDVSRINKLGWHAPIPLAEGLARTYDWYRTNLASLRL